MNNPHLESLLLDPPFSEFPEGVDSSEAKKRQLMLLLQMKSEFSIHKNSCRFEGKRFTISIPLTYVRYSRAPAVAGTKFPAMSQEEVEDWLSHIPVFAVTDSNGAGVVLKPDGEESVFYFFMSPMMANATLNTLTANNKDMDLKISAFSLGKIWFKILNGDKDTEVMVGLNGFTKSALESLLRLTCTHLLIFSFGKYHSSRHLEVMEREKAVKG